jgi:diguanylate cyclase (GGDEF)-like protein/PAS domain S-box-containing protein
VEPLAELQAWLTGQSLAGTAAIVDGHVAFANARFEQLLGYGPGELQGIALADLIADGDRKDALPRLEAAGEIRAAFRALRKDGMPVQVELRGTHGTFQGHPATLILMLDVSEGKRSGRRASDRERPPYENAVEGVYQSDLDGHVVKCNAVMARIFGFKTPRELIDLGVEETHALYLRPDRWREFRRLVEEKDGITGFESQVRRRDGSVIWISENARTVRDGSGALVGFEGTVVEITARKRAETQLRHDALHDSLTGLPNRALFMDRLRQALARLRAKGDQFALLVIDLDRFKVVNDSLGHRAGDQLLAETARRLQRCARPQDTVARLGGDEFALLYDGSEALELADRLQKELSAPHTLAGQELVSTSSIGIAYGAPHYQSAEEILRDADLAMYRAKARGRAGHAEFDPAMHKKAVALLQLESDLRRALERRELVLHYQPVVSLETGAIAGFEALVHWKHPQRGLLRPLEFVPLAEETGLVVPIGEWVLREACRQTRDWQLRFSPSLSVGVNISARQFLNSDVVGMVAAALRESNLPPRALRLELTESMLMDNAPVAAGVLDELRALGVSLDLDDFGTGYSSLSYLNDFRLDTLKIDRSFLAGSWEIVTAIVNLARGLRLTLIAEGVENDAQLEQLRKLGCEYGQGYLFGRPLDAEAMEEILRTKGVAGLAPRSEAHLAQERGALGVPSA